MKKSVILAVLIAIAAVGWVLTGQYGDKLGLASDVERKPAGSVAERLVTQQNSDRRVAVRVQHSVAVDRALTIVARGRTEAWRKVDIKAEVVGQVVDLPFKKGARVKRGDVIARLEINAREAQLDEAKALVRQREIEYNAAKKLRAKGFSAETTYAGAKASLDAAHAMVKRMQVELDKTVIRAPFDGVIDERMAELGAFLKDGNPIARLVDEEPYLVVAEVSEDRIGQLEVGQPGSARLATGREIAGTIRFIASVAYSATRTFRVELEVPNEDRSLRDGITADVRFPTEVIKAHLVSPAVLTLNDAGLVGVRCLDADERVVFHPVDVIGDQPNGVWIAGLPERIDLITVGQEYVRDGDSVKAIRTEGATS